MQTPDEHLPPGFTTPLMIPARITTPGALPPHSRKEAYMADITYGTSAEFGFDYLRDNMVSDFPNASSAR